MKPTSSKFIQGIVLITGFCFSVYFCSAQIPAAPQKMSVWMLVRPGDTTMMQQNTLESLSENGPTQFHQFTQLSGMIHLVLSDTSNISQIVVSLGSTPGGSDIFQKTFTNAQGIFQDGTYIDKKRWNIINIGLGNFTGANVNSFYAQVYFENANQGASPVITYSKK